MKISRHKKVHRYLSFFCNNFGFHLPYQVLIDGTFCYAALKNQFNIKEQMPKYLDGEVKLLTTPCVVLETEALGHAVFGAMVIVKQFAIHRCDHTGKPVPGSICLKSMLGTNNPNRYIIATQDRELQSAARKIPGTPLLYLHQRAPTLERPSEQSQLMAHKRNQAKFEVSKETEEIILGLKKKKLGFVETEVSDKKKKKKKKKGQNPLSCKKKKKQPKTNEQEAGVQKRRKRKRIKIPQHIKEQIIANVKQ